MNGWRIPRAQSVLRTPRGVVASGPGGAYSSPDGETWTELKLWREDETGAADFLHAYWMGRYYGFIKPPESGAPSILPTLSINHPKALPYTGPERPNFN